MSTPRSISSRVATRLVVTAGLAAAVGVGFSLGRAGDPVGDPSSGPLPSQPSQAAPLALANADLRSPTSCDDLLASYVDRGVDRVGPYGWDGPMVAFTAGDMSRSVDSAEAGTASNPSTSRSTSSESGTNVQEAGVDEPDVVKADDSTLVRLQDGGLRVYDVSGTEPVELGSLAVPDTNGTRWDGQARGEMLLVRGRVVVIGASKDGLGTTVTTVDLADPASPTVVDSTEITGTLEAARLHGDVVRLVLSSGLPTLDFVHPGDERTELEATRANQAVVGDSALADWLPTIAGEPMVACDDVAIPDDEAPLGSTTVVAFDPADPTGRTVSAVATATVTSYFSPDRLYLAAGQDWWGGCWGPCPAPGARDLAFAPGGTTQLYAFALDGHDTTYVASGEVDGSIADRWSMDAVGGSLRVAVGPTVETGNFNSVITLREDASRLVEEGAVDKLGVGEEIKSVRWFDDLAIVVTFRQTDPLYAVDLTDPAAPALLGELKIPGFSDYLHPLGERRLIGMGQDVSSRGMVRGAQAALFDVSDLSAPRQLDVVRYPRQSSAHAGADPRQFTWLPDRRTALTVVSKGWTGVTGWVSVLTLDGDGSMDNRMVEVEHGRDVAQVRLVPLVSGKVVLVTGEDVTFFDL